MDGDAEAVEQSRTRSGAFLVINRLSEAMACRKEKTTYGHGVVAALNGSGAALAGWLVASDELGWRGDSKDSEGCDGGELEEHGSKLVWFG